MRLRTLITLAAVGLAVAAPVALAAESTPLGGSYGGGIQLTGSYGGGKQLTYTLDGSLTELAPVEGQNGAYTLTQHLWSKKQNVQWFSLGPPPAIGSMPVTKFAALLAKRATSDGATAPIAHVSYTHKGRIKHFLATVSLAEAGLGAATAPSVQATLSPISLERLQAIAGGTGLLSKIAAGCLKTVTAPPGMACTASAPVIASRASQAAPSSIVYSVDQGRTTRDVLKNNGNYDPDSISVSVSIG